MKNQCMHVVDIVKDNIRPTYACMHGEDMVKGEHMRCVDILTGQHMQRKESVNRQHKTINCCRNKCEMFAFSKRQACPQNKD